MSTDTTSGTSPELQIFAGHIQFHDHHIPALADGDYTITVKHDMLQASGIPSFAPRHQQFSVQGPRFTLDPAEIRACHPAPNSDGLFENCLPHIVLARRALPWERRLGRGGQYDGLPWLALLLFDEGEIAPPPTSPEAAAPGPTRAGTITVGDLRHPRAAEQVLTPAIPDLGYGEDDSVKCQAIDVDAASFRAVVPRLEELRYLAHCRQVNVSHKMILGMKHSGWFAVVITGRLPAPGRQIAHLVSLEGLADYLPRLAGQSSPIAASRVRLASLASWVFTCQPASGVSFSRLADLATAGAADDLLLRLPVAPALPADPEGGEVARAGLTSGYVPMAYQTLPGDQTFAWYRGPLVPIVTPHFTGGRAEPFGSAAEAMIYDQSTGVFNLSYAVAWQTGRLLALADRGFATTLLDWRRQVLRPADLLLARRELQARNALLQGADTRDLLAPRLATDALLGYLVDGFAKGAAGRLLEPPARPHLAAQRRSPAATRRPAALRHLVTSPEVRQVLARSAQGAGEPGTEESAAFAQIVGWLARLCLLEGVPFDNLVPDARMLPRESIRFFYLDRNWLDSLMDGALSIGIHSSRDSQAHQITCEALRSAAHTALEHQRQRLLPPGQRPATPTAAGDTVAGLLLRSAIVGALPGLEVHAFRTITGDAGDVQPADQISLLRMERLAPDLLLCLFPEVPAWVELCEPGEELIFGLEETDRTAVGQQARRAEQIELRYVSDRAGGRVGALVGRAGATIAPRYRADSPRLLDLADLVTQLSDKRDQIGATGAIGPADLAVQLVKVPERVVFQRGSNI